MVKGLDVYGKSNEEENDILWGIGFWREGLEKMYSNLNIGVKVWVFNRYVVPTDRVVVPTGRYVVPAGKVIIIVSPGRLNLVPTGRILSPGSKDLSKVGSNNYIPIPSASLPHVPYRSRKSMAKKQTNGSITTWEDLETKFLSKYCPPARTTKKTEEINNFQQEPDKNLYQAWEQFKELLIKCPQHYLTDMQEVVLFYNGLDVPTRQILDSKGAIPSKTIADAKTAIQEIVEYSQKWHNGTSRVRSTETSDGLAATQAQLNNLGREIKKVNEKVYAAQVGCEQCKGPHYTKDCPLKEEGKILEEAYYMQFDRTMKYLKGIAENVLVGISKFTFLVDSIILDMPEDIKVPLILGRPYLSTARAKINVYKRKITLRVEEENIIFKIVKHASSLIKRVYMLEDYIELIDLNEPFKLRRNQIDDLMPTIEECEVIEEFRTRDDELNVGINDYPILEDMDAYRDEGMGDVIVGEPFLREVSEEDKMNGISHPYQKLKGFYKGVLNLGPDYIRDAKMEEWLTRRHISVNEME
ncbi:gag-pol polyprotein [Tanacetum coccineum]